MRPSGGKGERTSGFCGIKCTYYATGELWNKNGSVEEDANEITTWVFFKKIC